MEKHLAKYVGQSLIDNPLPLDQRVVFTPDERRFLLIGTQSARGFDIPTKTAMTVGIDQARTPVFSDDWDVCVAGSTIHQNLQITDTGDAMFRYALEYKDIKRLPGAVDAPREQVLGIPDPFRTPVVALSRDKKYAAVASDGVIVRLYHVATARELWHCRPHSQEVTAMALSPDNNALVTAGQEGMLKVWNLEHIRRELNTLGLGW